MEREEKQELQGMLNDLMQGIGQMLNEQEKRIKTEIMAYIEGGVEKKVDLLAEQMEALGKRQDAMEEQLGRLTEDVQVVKAAVASHEDELYSLRRIK